ncbi:MAG: cyclic nucleotide-binding domain-containing protein [Ignavibacteriae bacterium]|nr:cyclic nucleotide-binding domain-containing protein [Ignavibacteriota bacterium]
MAEKDIRNYGVTQIKRLEQYKDRWSSFGASTGILEISEKPTPSILRRYDIFKDYDDTFLEKISPDISVARWKRGTLLFEEGSYIDIAFFVAEGAVDVYIEKQQDALGARPIFDPNRTQFDPAGAASGAASKGVTVFEAQSVKQKKTDPKAKGKAEKAAAPRREITFLSVMDFDMPAGATARLGAGELFGEIGALSGWPQSVTARTADECVLVQIRVPALRLMRRKSAALKQRLDALYRERSLFAQLKATPLFRHCDDAFLNRLASGASLVSLEPGEAVCTQGADADAIYLVRSGFLKLTQAVASGRLTVSYLSKGMTLGESELLLENTSGWLSTAESVEYAELVQFPRGDFVQALREYPSVEKMLWTAAIARIKETGYSRKHIEHAEFIDTALGEGLVEGNSILVIDLARCTRCDDCVKGCADTHGGVPRFVREGEKYKNLLITRACYHCEDPVCLVGCPTGAIRRTAVGDVVAIDDDLCIGCASCANNCPYDAITMFAPGGLWPADTIPEGLRGKERQLASKCDLCYTSPSGPACVNSCPQGCATRVSTIDQFQTLFIDGARRS